jgi:aminomethyltransferase
MSTSSELRAEARTLRHTPLHGLHVRHGARMVPFAGYEMPLHYLAGIIQEHLHTRKAAGLFDVSHMGQLLVHARSGDQTEAARALELLVASDVLSLSKGRQRYSLLTNEHGGILDDLMIANLGDRFILIVNASRKAADEERLRQLLSGTCNVERLDTRALLALQGPSAEEALARLAPTVGSMRFMDVREISILGVECFVSRSGYTGEDGFEISVPANAAEELATKLLQQSGVAMTGLGARDSLRLEAGLCLYGNDIDESTTPIEAGLTWAIQPSRRFDGARPGGFPGAYIVLQQLAAGASRLRVGLRPQGRGPIRAGAALFLEESASEPVGHVTSGGFGSSINAPIAMGYVGADAARLGALLFAEVRGKRLPVSIASLPFVRHNYRRN